MRLAGRSHKPGRMGNATASAEAVTSTGTRVTPLADFRRQTGGESPRLASSQPAKVDQLIDHCVFTPFTYAREDPAAQMVLEDQRLQPHDRAPHGVGLLHDVDARLTRLDHPPHAMQVAFDVVEPAQGLSPSRGAAAQPCRSPR